MRCSTTATTMRDGKLSTLHVHNLTIPDQRRHHSSSSSGGGKHQHHIE
jgi:hypothetical protein